MKKASIVLVLIFAVMLVAGIACEVNKAELTDSSVDSYGLLTLKVQYTYDPEARVDISISDKNGNLICEEKSVRYTWQFAKIESNPRGGEYWYEHFCSGHKFVAGNRYELTIYENGKTVIHEFIYPRSTSIQHGEGGYWDYLDR